MSTIPRFYFFCNITIFVDNFNVKKRLKFKHYLYICRVYIIMFDKVIMEFCDGILMSHRVTVELLY